MNVTTREPGTAPGQTVAYSLHGNCYLNITNRCTLRCGFCPKFRGNWTVQGYDLHLRYEPTVHEMVEAVGDPRRYQEVVFCGLGEPTLRLYDALEAAVELRNRGATQLRLNTDGLASLVYGRDVTPDLEGLIDALSISLNAQDEEAYNRHCRPILPGAYQAMLDFTDRARDFVPDITLTVIDGLEGVDIAACQAVARRLNVKFRRRVLDEVGVETKNL